MSVALKHILELVGKLDDSPGNDTPRERFRKFLTENVSEIGQVRDYLEECLREPGGQHVRALQDLVNFLGRFLGLKWNLEGIKIPLCVSSYPQVGTGQQGCGVIRRVRVRLCVPRVRGETRQGRSGITALRTIQEG